jgi:hypothetical protein
LGLNKLIFFFKKLIISLLDKEIVLFLRQDVTIVQSHFNTQTTMEEILKKAAELYSAFAKDANAQVEKGNKAAGTRARKASLELEKLMKEFRKASLAASR